MKVIFKFKDGTLIKQDLEGANLKGTGNIFAVLNQLHQHDGTIKLADYEGKFSDLYAVEILNS